MSDKSIIEKLGIEQIERRYAGYYKPSEGYISVCRDEDVSEVEKQRDEMLEALIKRLIDSEKDYVSESIFKKDFNKEIRIIEKACYPKSWNEIKVELYNTPEGLKVK